MRRAFTSIAAVFGILVPICCLDGVQSQQELGVAIRNINNNHNIVRRERYEYNGRFAPGGARRHYPHRHQEAGPFAGVLPGLALTVASSWLQWWNEGRAVREARMLSEARKEVVTLDVNAPIQPENEGKLVHVAGQVTSRNGVRDGGHGLFRPKALQLVRSTEAYQWNERKSERRTRVSSSETRVEVEYRYDMEWTSRPIDSSGFESGQHHNPYPNFTLGRHTMTANDAKLPNGLRVPGKLVDQIANRNVFSSGGIDRTKPILLDESGVKLAYNDGAIIASNTLYFSENDRLSEQSSVGSEASSNAVATTDKKNAVVRRMPQPFLGDVRVSWQEVIPPHDGVSILAKQQGNTLVPWVHDRGQTVYHLSTGEVTPESMIDEMIRTRQLVTKSLRIGGWIGAFFGLKWTLSCIPALVELLPLGIGGFLAPLARIATSTVAFGASLGLSAAVIGVAWLRFRPLLAVGLTVVSSAGFLGPLWYARGRRSPELETMGEKLAD